MAPFLEFLKRGLLPTDVAEAYWLVRQAKRYKIVDEQLYH